MDNEPMPIEKSAGVIVFYKGEEEPKFLLLHYPGKNRDYWDFPKGHIERGERELDAARREVEEETGLKDIKFVEGFKEPMKYFFKFSGKNVLKFVTFYLAETGTKDIRISGEHKGFKWLAYKEALEQLTFQSAKDILKKVKEFLKSKE